MCGTCQMVFETHQKQSSHCANHHGFKNPARALAVGTSCPCCLFEYHSNERLVSHIKAQRRKGTTTNCYTLLHTFCPPASVGQSAVLEAEEDIKEGTQHHKKGRKPAKTAFTSADAPVTRLQGPLQQWAS